MRSRRILVSAFWKVRKLSDHDDFRQFLNSLEKMLDTITNIVYTARCKIQVERELVNHAETDQKEASDPTESDAPSSSFRQGGPQPHVQGTPRETARSTKETEAVQMRGGRMEVPHGRA